MTPWLRLRDGQFVRVDPEDQVRLKRYKWTRKRFGRRTYIERNATVEGRYVKIQLHREIMRAMKGQFVSFKSEDETDYRKCNLVLSGERKLPRTSEKYERLRANQEVVDGRIYCPRCKDWMPFYEWSSFRPHGKATAWRYCAGCAKRTRSKRSEKVRRLVFDHYGRACSCCGEPRIEFLTIDHANNDGNKQRTEKKCGTGEKFYGWIIKNGFPTDLRTMCFNCNIGREHHGVCPHETERAAPEGTARVSSPDTSTA